MGEPQEGSGLQLHIDVHHERSEWFFQRLSWGLMLLLTSAALLGFLGAGPFSNVQAGKVGDDLYVEYERFVRQEAPFSVRFYCNAKGSDEFNLGLDRAFLSRSEVMEVQPTPVKTTAAGEECIFTFKSAGEKKQLVTFRFESDSFGKLQTEVTLNGTSKQKLKQFIWP
jgi:hypothetical protein